VQIAIINGPNLNLTGIREPEIYGNTGMDAWLLQTKAKHPNINISYYQSNVEGEIINALQQFGQDKAFGGIVLNAGAYTHTSIAIADAVAATPIPVIAVHISNPLSREPERHTDLLLGKCKGVISGLGLYGYEMALVYFRDNITP
jgi:3-dehydroquinate dehydratase-2